MWRPLWQPFHLTRMTPREERQEIWICHSLRWACLTGVSLCEHLLLLNGSSTASSYLLCPLKCKPVSVLCLMYNQRKIYPRDLGEKTLTMYNLCLPYLLPLKPKSSVTGASIRLYANSSSGCNMYQEAESGINSQNTLVEKYLERM